MVQPPDHLAAQVEPAVLPARDPGREPHLAVLEAGLGVRWCGVGPGEVDPHRLAPGPVPRAKPRGSAPRGR